MQASTRKVRERADDVQTENNSGGEEGVQTVEKRSLTRDEERETIDQSSDERRAEIGSVSVSSISSASVSTVEEISDVEDDVSARDAICGSYRQVATISGTNQPIENGSLAGEEQMTESSFVRVTSTSVEDFDVTDIYRATATRKEVRERAKQTFGSKISTHKRKSSSSADGVKLTAKASPSNMSPPIATPVIRKEPTEEVKKFALEDHTIECTTRQIEQVEAERRNLTPELTNQQQAPLKDRPSNSVVKQVEAVEKELKAEESFSRCTPPSSGLGLNLAGYMGISTSKYGIALCDGRVGPSNEDLSNTIFVPYDSSGKHFTSQVYTIGSGRGINC